MEEWCSWDIVTDRSWTECSPLTFYTVWVRRHSIFCHNHRYKWNTLTYHAFGTFPPNMCWSEYDPTNIDDWERHIAPQDTYKIAWWPSKKLRSNSIASFIADFCSAWLGEKLTKTHDMWRYFIYNDDYVGKISCLRTPTISYYTVLIHEEIIHVGERRFAVSLGTL